MKLLLISSPNGLGHARRLLHVAKGLKPNAEVKIAATIRNFKLLQRESVSLGIENSDWVTFEPIGLDSVLTRKPGAVIKSEVQDKSLMSEFEKVDAIISDNSVWPADHHPNVFLMGHFLWQDFFAAQSEPFVDSQLKELLQREKSQLIKVRKWFHTTKFTKLGDNSYPSLKEIPMVRYSSDRRIQNKNEQLEEIWLANGRTGLESRKPPPSGWRLRKKESHFLNSGSSPKLIVGRPGLGTIRDCLAHAVPFIGYGQRNNPELQNNLKTYRELLAEKGVTTFDTVNSLLCAPEEEITAIQRASEEIWGEISATPRTLGLDLMSEINLCLSGA